MMKNKLETLRTNLKSQLGHGTQKAKKLTEKTVNFIIYRYRLASWKLLVVNKTRFTRFFNRHFGSLRRVTFVVAALIVGLLINFYGGNNFTPDLLSNYLVVVGAMTGGTIAIVFTISIFLLQSTTDLFASQYLEEYVHDWKEKFVYFVVTLTTIFLLGASLFVGSFAKSSPSFLTQPIFHAAVLLSLFLIGLAFALIDWQYKVVREKLNPFVAISFLEKKGVGLIKRVQYQAAKAATVFQAKDKTLTNEMALAQAYHLLSPSFISNLDRQLETLVEISMKVADKQEVGTTRRGFAAIQYILTAFIQARESSSVAIPAGFLFLAVVSDSQDFFAKNFERLNKAGEKFIKEGKEESATDILDVYDALAKKATPVQYINRTGESPILEQITGYLEGYVEHGQLAKNLEVVFQGSRILGGIAVVATEKGFQAMLLGLQKKLLSIAVYGFTEKQMLVVDNCVVAYLRIIEVAFIGKRTVASRQYDTALKNLGIISGYASSLQKSGYIPNDIMSSINLRKGFDELRPLIVRIAQHYFTLTEDREKHSYRNELVDFFKEIYRSLRSLSETIKECGNSLVDSVGLLLTEMNSVIIQLMQDAEFDDVKSELAERLRWNVHLPSFFISHAEKVDGSSHPFNSLTDSTAKTGIWAATKLKDKELVCDSISALSSITDSCLNKIKNSYGYDEPRVLQKACYLGILALKNGWDEVFTEVGLKIYDFEPKYFAKYLTNLPPGIDPENHNVMGLPQKDQLYIELLQWRDEFETERLNGTLRIRDDAEAMMYELIKPIDIDRFIFEVWRTFPAGSEIEKEVEERYARKWTAKKLVSILKGRMQNLG